MKKIILLMLVTITMTFSCVSSQSEDSGTVLSLDEAIALYEGMEGIETIKELVEKGINANDHRMTPLMYALQYGYIDLVTSLIDAGADVNFQEIIILPKIIEGTNVTTSLKSDPPLIYAIRSGDIETVKVLLKAGADVNAKNEHGQIALMTATYNGHRNDGVKKIKVLIEAGSNVNEKNNYGETALITAAATGSIEMVKVLIKAGADVNVQAQDGNTALTAAANWMGSNGKYTETIKALIDAGADVEAQNNYERTALMLASYRGNIDTVAALIKGTANVTARDSSHQSVLMDASRNGYTDVMNMLIKAGAHVDEVFSDVTFAAYTGDIESLKVFINAGENIDTGEDRDAREASEARGYTIRSSRGNRRNALIWAALNGKTMTVKVNMGCS